MSENNDAVPDRVSEWALEAARATIGAKLASRVAVGLAVFVGVGGIAVAISQAVTQRNFDATMLLGTTAYTLINAAFWAGLLLVAGTFLRLQAARFDLEMVGSESETPVEEGSS